jgi:hypothetical protein
MNLGRPLLLPAAGTAEGEARTKARLAAALTSQ